MKEQRYALTDRGRIAATFATLEQRWPDLEPGERAAILAALELVALELRRCRRTRRIAAQEASHARAG